MAKQEQSEQVSENVLSTGGLDLDSSPSYVKEGSYTYALNAIISNFDGNQYLLQNNFGNALCLNLPTGYYINGNCIIDNDNKILFIVNPSKGFSGIGILNSNCTYTPLIQDNTCLGFSITNQIQAEYKATYNCGKNVYWTDNLNPRRYLNIEKIPYTNSSNISDINCDQLLVQPIIQLPTITYYDINEDGILIAGDYKPFIQYSDINGIGYTDWFETINEIPIFKSNIGGPFVSIEGSPPGEQTTKGINFQFGILDTNFQYFNLGIISTIQGVTTASKIITLPIGTTNYIYSGLEVSTSITLDEVLAESTTYTTAKTVCQSNGYLIWGNLTSNKDPNFQPLANNIQITWQTSQVPAYYSLSNLQYPQTTTYNLGFMRDEVYAIGIRLLYTDGTKSCTYHIPGRGLNIRANGNGFGGLTIDQYGQPIIDDPEKGVLWDTTLINVNSDNSIPYNPRWQVYNTGTLDGTVSTYNPSFYGSQCYTFGQCSYWQSNLLYPSDINVWGPLAGTPIRHHKMPDCNICPLFNNDNSTDEPKLNYLGINIDNVIIPTNNPDYENVVGWEIVVGDRTHSKSIIAKGLTYYTYNMVDAGTSSTYTIPSQVYNDIGDGSSITCRSTQGLNKSIFHFFSPDTTFKNPNITADTLKFESEFYGSANQVVGAIANVAFNTNVGIFNECSGIQYTSVNRNITTSTYLLYNSLTAQGAASYAWLMDKSESCIGIQVNSNILNPINQDHSNTDMNCNIGSSPISVYYAALKLTNINQYGTIDSISYISKALTQSINNTFLHCVFGGDTFLSNYAFHRTRPYNTNTTGTDNGISIADLGSNINTDLTTIPFNVNSSWVESSINTELRYAGTSGYDTFYPYCTNNRGDWGTAAWGFQALRPGTSNFQDNFWLYNTDYSTQNISKYICTQPADFDPNACLPHYSTRAIYSPQSQQESKQDFWLLYPALNFYDFPKNKGELWNIKNMNRDKILFQFENTAYIIQGSETIQTNQEIVQISTGTLFQQDPKEMNSSDVGYGGTRSQWSTLGGPEGVFYIDDKRNKIYFLPEIYNTYTLPKLEEISDLSLKTWFNNNLNLNLLTSFPNFLLFDNPTNPDGIGFTSVYDNTYDLLYITKRDYLPNISGITCTDGLTFTYNNNIVKLSNPDYFINKSWTLCFSPTTKKWISWQSFIPNGYLYQANNYQTINNTGSNSSIWNHNIQGLFSNYYGVQYPHIIEYVSKISPLSSKKTSLQFITDCYDYSIDPNYPYDDRYTTYDKAVVYSNEHCTGYLNLYHQDANNLSTINNFPITNTGSINTPLEKVVNIWKFHDLWDRSANRSINNPLFTTQWSNPDYKQQYPIDKVVNNNAINYNKEWFNIRKIDAAWTKVRLFFNNSTKKLITNLFISRENIDKR